MAQLSLEPLLTSPAEIVTEGPVRVTTIFWVITVGGVASLIITF